MRRTVEPDNYNRGKWRFVIFVAGAKAGEHLKIKVAEVGNWFDNAPSSLSKFRRKARKGS
jgi:hypothetical protein